MKNPLFLIKSYLLYRLSKPNTVRLANTEQEKQAIYHFRYQVYVNKMRKTFLPYIDHKNKMIKDPYDNEPYTLNFYIKNNDAVVATIRLFTFPPEKLPDKIAKEYQIHRIPKYKKFNITILNYFLSASSSIMDTLKLIHTTAIHVYKHPTELCICFFGCDPGLINYYEKIGARMFTNEYTYFSDGVRIPLVIPAQDFTFLYKNKIKTYLMYKHYAKPSKLQSQNKRIIKETSEFLDEFSHKKEMRDNKAITVDAELMTNNKKEQFNFLDAFTKDELMALSSLIFTVKAGEVIVKHGVKDKEIFVILSGSLIVTHKDVIITELGPGNIIGELSFFLPAGHRIATVTTKTDAKLLVIKRNILRHLKDNDLVIKFLETTCTLLANKIATTNERILSEYDEGKNNEQ